MLENLYCQYILLIHLYVLTLIGLLIKFSVMHLNLRYSGMSFGIIRAVFSVVIQSFLSIIRFLLFSKCMLFHTLDCVFFSSIYLTIVMNKCISSEHVVAFRGSVLCLIIFFSYSVNSGCSVSTSSFWSFPVLGSMSC